MTPTLNEETSAQGHHHETPMRIHINRNIHESPNPTHGHALYVLGSVPAGHHLYREVQGDEEDEPIFNRNEDVHLYRDEHFYSTTDAFKGYTIVVNAVPKTVHQNYLSFEEVVALAFPKPAGPNTIFTVSYRGGCGKNPEGTLVLGQKVKIKNKMVFNVTATNKS